MNDFYSPWSLSREDRLTGDKLTGDGGADASLIDDIDKGLVSTSVSSIMPLGVPIDITELDLLLVVVLVASILILFVAVNKVCDVVSTLFDVAGLAADLESVEQVDLALACVGPLKLRVGDGLSVIVDGALLVLPLADDKLRDESDLPSSSDAASDLLSLRLLASIPLLLISVFCIDDDF